MATTPTNKPIPSEDPRDLKFNAGKIDEEVNGSADYYTDRFSAQRLTNTGRNNLFQDAQTQRESDFQQFLLNSGYQFLGDYENGPYTITVRNQIIRYQNEFWRLNASTNPPYTTTGVNSISWAVDVTHVVSVGDANLRQELANPLLGASMIALSQGGNVANGLRYLTLEMFSPLVTSGDWSAALSAALTKSIETGLPIEGFNTTYSIGTAVTKECRVLRNAKFIPLPGYTGIAPSFNTPSDTGEIRLNNLSFIGFVARGPRIQRGSFTGTPTVILSDIVCENNGALLRTTTTGAVNTANTFVIPVVSSSGFAVGDAIWIGDSKCLILTIDSATQITLVNDGTKPTLQPGGLGTGSYSAGQYFTKDGDGKNGLTIGHGGSTYNVSITGRSRFSGNGWFGLFNWANDAPAAGTHVAVVGAEANDNGYIGLGLAKLSAGNISHNMASRNGNNGIDINKATTAVTISYNEASLNGVDGIFTGSYSTSPGMLGNYSYNNFRTGILYSGDSAGSVGAIVNANTVKDNPLNGICMTGVKSYSVVNNTFDGVCYQHLKVEGRNGKPNPNAIIDKNAFITAATDNDVFGVLGGYTSGGNNGVIVLTNNRHANARPAISLTAFDRSNSMFIPDSYVVPVTTGTGTAGANIAVSFTAYKAHDTATIDIAATWANLQLATNITASTIDTATATRTAGMELGNTATSNGKIIAGFQFGTLSYNFNSAIASTKYLHYNSGGRKGYVQLTWS